MAEKTKNLCAQIPEDLHNRVREEQEHSGQTLSQYVTWLKPHSTKEGGKTIWGKRGPWRCRYPPSCSSG